MARQIDPMLDTAACGFLALDEHGTVQLANTTLAELLDIPRARIEGQHVDQLLSAAGRIFYNTHLFPLLRLRGRVEEVYVPFRSAHGAEIPVLVNGVSRSRDGGNVYELVAVPMRQRNELESELVAARNIAQEAASAKDRFLAIVSHELRTPLSAVKGYGELLLREARGPLTEAQRKYVTRILDAATYQVGLIEDILEYARLDGGRRGMQPMRHELEEVLSRAESLLSVRAEEEGRLLRREPTPATGAVMADGPAVQQILLNLGMNAVKYSAAESEVLIRAEAIGSRIRIAVVDAGPGIAESDLERIFEPFVQTSTEGGSKRGVGLGLPISRDLARAMGGDISVTSVLGQGSTFTLELPAA